MKKILAASTAAIALTLAAAPAHAANFVGASWGIDVGYGTGEANSENFGFIGGPYIFTQNDADIDGALLGVHVNNRWSAGSNMVFGIEGEVRYEGIEGDDKGSGGDHNELSADWEASIQAQLGLIVDPTMMVYALGGWSWLGADSNITNAPTETVSQTYSGWTAGAGIEFGLSDNANMRVQYRYSKYSEERLTFTTNAYDMATGPSISDITVGLNIAF